MTVDCHSGCLDGCCDCGLVTVDCCRIFGVDCGGASVVCCGGYCGDCEGMTVDCCGGGCDDDECCDGSDGCSAVFMGTVKLGSVPTMVKLI